MQEERKTVVIPYTPRELQNEIHNNLDRFNVVVCHRRFGKTVFAVNELIKSAVQDGDIFETRYITYLQLMNEDKTDPYRRNEFK